MSPSMAEHEQDTAFAAAVARVRGLRARAERAWASARGRVPRHVAYLQLGRIRSWSDGGVQAEADSFAAWCEVHAGSDVVVRVAGPLTRNLAVDASVALREPDAVRRYARQQFAHYHGAAAAGWPLATWPGGATTLHGIDLAALQSAASAHDVRVGSIAPAWSAGLDGVTLSHPAFGGPGRHALLLVEGAAATWLVAHDARVVALRQRYLDAAHVDDVAHLLQALLDEDEPLDGLPIVAGWDVDTPRPLPAGMAEVFGPLANDGVLSHWLRGATP